MSNFAFLQSEWPLLFEAATKAEGMTVRMRGHRASTPRRTLEMAVGWLYKHDKAFRLPNIRTNSVP